MPDPSFRPSPGDHLRLPDFQPGVHVRVTAVGDVKFLGIAYDHHGAPALIEQGYLIGDDWLPALPPHVYPERWLVLTRSGQPRRFLYETPQNALDHMPTGSDDVLLLGHLLPTGELRWENPPLPDPGFLTNPADARSGTGLVMDGSPPARHESEHGGVLYAEVPSVDDLDPRP